MSEPMLTLKNITKVFNEGTQDEKRALDDLSLEVADGDFITIIGTNGSGKSTTRKRQIRSPPRRVGYSKRIKREREGSEGSSPLPNPFRSSMNRW